MEQLKKQLADLKFDVDTAYQKMNISQLSAELDALRHKMAEADFWQDSVGAQVTTKRESELSHRVAPWQYLRTEIDELSELVNLNDASLVPELESRVENLESRVSSLKQQLKYQGPFDDHDVILSVYAGAGGTDAQDWAQILLRMYSRWAEKQKLSISTIESSAGEEAGIKSTTIKLSGGDFLYGQMSGEHGVHRLVRLSPFNADHKRQTSFAKVEVLPAIDRPDEVEFDDKDLKIDVYRAGGHGGQSVNTTDSAVRITHIPTGISVAIQNERSQLQNKETALSVLKSKLMALQLEQHAENLAEVKGPNQSAEWGSQIRSYVLHPYKQVKDLRTGYETSDVDKVLDGDLSEMITAWLDSRV